MLLTAKAYFRDAHMLLTAKAYFRDAQMLLTAKAYFRDAQMHFKTNNEIVKGILGLYSISFM